MNCTVVLFPLLYSFFSVVSLLYCSFFSKITQCFLAMFSLLFPFSVSNTYVLLFISLTIVFFQRWYATLFVSNFFFGFHNFSNCCFPIFSVSVAPWAKRRAKRKWRRTTKSQAVCRCRTTPKQTPSLTTNRQTRNVVQLSLENDYSWQHCLPHSSFFLEAAIDLFPHAVRPLFLVHLPHLIMFCIGRGRP